MLKLVFQFHLQFSQNKKRSTKRKKKYFISLFSLMNERNGHHLHCKIFEINFIEEDRIENQIDKKAEMQIF